MKQKLVVDVNLHMGHELGYDNFLITLSGLEQSTLYESHL